MKRTLLTAVVVVAAVGVLAGCGGNGESTVDGAAGPGGATTAAAPAPRQPTCDLAPASLVNSVLGTGVGDPVAQNLAGTVVCRYPAGSNPTTVIVRIQTDMTEAVFTKARQTSDASGLPTSDLPGFADRAYTSTLKVGASVTNTVVALKGSVQILVSSPATFDAEKALEEQLFAKLA